MALVPLVMVAMNLIYALSAYPFGKLSDRVSHTQLLTIGLIVLIAADVVLAVNDYWWVVLEAKPGQDAAGTLTDAVVQRIDVARGEVILQHGDILNLGMPAMTMAFEADRKMLDRIRPGDKVRFHAEILEGKLIVTQIERAR